MSATRGPLGTEVMGVSWAIPAKDAPQTDADWGEFIRLSQPEALATLRRHVGGIQPRTEPKLDMDGPHSDPLQGPIYVLTVSAWFVPEELPVDCPAYKARGAERGRG